MPVLDQQPAEVEEEQNEAGEATEPEEQEDFLKSNPDAQNAIKELLKSYGNLEPYERRSEVVDARRARFYWRDIQYIYLKKSAPMFSTAAGAMSGGNIDSGSSTDMPKYTDVYNIFTPVMEIIISALTQNPPGVNWQPNNPGKPEDQSAAQAGEKYKNVIDRDIERKKLQAEIARLFCTDSRVVLHTWHDEDEEDEDGPGKAKIKAYGVLESRVIPITAKCREEVVCTILTDDPEVNLAKEEYPDAAGTIKPGPSGIGESAYERYMRLGVLQGTRTGQAGSAYDHLTVRQKVWLRKAAFLKVQDLKLREQFQSNYPDGVCVTFCGGIYCDSYPASIDKQISIGHPLPGDGMARSSLGKRVIPLQDYFNDGMNLAKEAHDYCIPVVYQVMGSQDIDALRWQTSQPGNNEPLELPPGIVAAADCFFEQAMDGIPASLPEFLEMIQGPLLEFITGALPSVQGAPDDANQTKGGREMARDQALGRLGLPWGALQELMASAYSQAAESAGENAEDGVEAAYQTKGRLGRTMNGSVELAALKRGKFHCHPDTDSNFPETVGTKRNSYNALMAASATNPAVAEIMNQPENLELGHEWNGLPELKIPQAEAELKQLEEIQELLKTSPIPPSPQELIEIVAKQQQMEQMAQQATTAWQPVPPPPPLPGQPPTPEELATPGFDWMSNLLMKSLAKPSIDADTEADFNEYEWKTVQNWLSSAERREEDAKGNQKGVMNVRLHGLQHKKAIPPPMPPMPAGHKAGPPHVPPPATQAAPAARPGGLQ